MKNLIFFLSFFLSFFNMYSQSCISNDPGHVASTAMNVHNVEDAWQITCGDPNIVVAVVDIFSSQLHEDLQGKIDKIVEIDPMDTEWLECHHGISSAGIIAAVPDNGKATTGVGYDTKVALYNVANSCGSGGPTAGFYAAVANGESIINLSWQGGLYTGDVNNVQNYVNSGGVLTTAGLDNAWTAISGIDGVINVGRMAWDQSINSYVHLDYVNPNLEDKGIEIYVTAYNLMRLLEFDQWGPAGANGGAGGTSSTAPFVAGVVALIKSVNENLTPAEIECIIKLSARGSVANAPADAYAKILDAEAAVIMAGVWPNISIGEETILTGTQTLTNVTTTGHIRVKTGADITVTGSINLGHEDSRIFVERGARLVIDGADVSPISCIDEWRGFVVEGNASKQQPSSPFGALASDDAGVLVFQNQATVNNARNAVSMHNKHKSPVLSFTGGLVIAQNTTFNNNGRSFEFMRYLLGDNSQITDCTFNNNDNYVITAWRSSGLDIRNNNFNGYRRDGIFTATSVFNSSGNDFVGTGIIGGIDFEDQNVGVNINNGTAVDENYSVDNSTFTRNHFAIKFDGTDNAQSGNGSKFYDITSTNNDFGIFSQGSDHFRIHDGNFADENAAIISFNSGSAENQIDDNQISAGFSGIVIVNQNDMLKFYRNCFENMPNISEAGDIEIIRELSDIVTVHPEQFLRVGNNIIAPDNCFQDLSRDIVNGGNETIPNNLFSYGRDLTQAIYDCRVPLMEDPTLPLSLVYTFEDADSAHPGCDPNPNPGGGNPTYLTPHYCSPSSLSLTELNHDRIDIQSDIDALEALPNLNFAQLHLLRKLKRCLGKVEVNIAKTLISQNNHNTVRSSLRDSELEFTKVGVTSHLINKGLYNEAQRFMSAVRDYSTEWQEYVYSQNILIDFLSNFENYNLSSSDEHTLINTGKKSNYYAAFIRGVYAEIKQESIFVDFITNITVTKRNSNYTLDKIDVIISPNPTSNFIDISSDKNIISAISITSYTGQILVSKSNLESVNERIDLTNMQSGVLFVTTNLKDGSVITKKIIKI
jgi:hypothetical protein